MSLQNSNLECTKIMIPGGASLIYDDEIATVYSIGCSAVNSGETNEEYRYHKGDLCIFALWVLPQFSEEEIAARFANHPIIDGKYGISTIISYLLCSWKENVENETHIRIFLWIQTHISVLVASVLVIDFLRQLDEDSMIEFQRLSRNRFSVLVQDLIEKFLVFRMQQQIIQEYPSRDNVNRYPHSIRTKVSWDFCAAYSTNMFHQARTNEGAQNMQSIVANKGYISSLEISGLLMEMVTTHIKAISGWSIDKTMQVTGYLSDFVVQYVSNLQIRYPSAHQVLLRTARVWQVRTSTFLCNIDAEEIVELTLHKHLLLAYNCKNSDLKEDVLAVHATPEDCEAFLHILYNWDRDATSIRNQQRTITLGVAEIAVGFGITDVWRFLFGGCEFHPAMFMEDKPEDLLPLLYLLDKKQELHRIILEMPSIFYGSALYELVRKLNPAQIVSLVTHEALDWNVTQKYKALMMWAHAVCNKPCPEYALSCLLGPDIREKFELVKHALPIQSMKSWWGKLLIAGCINTKDLP